MPFGPTGSHLWSLPAFCSTGNSQIPDRIGGRSKLGFRQLTENGAYSFGLASANFARTAFLLDKGTNPNVRQMSGVTPLHTAVQNGKMEIVELPFAQGADPNAKLDNEMSSLKMAKEKSYP